MSGTTFADPVVLDWSAPSGTHTFALGSTPHLVVDSSQNASTAFFQPSAALDSDRNTCWETNALGPETSLTLRESDSSALTVVNYTLVARNGWAGRAPSAFTLYGSNDNANWTSVDSRTGITDWTGASDPTDVKSFALASPATFVYWKLIVTATQGGDVVNLGEIYFNGIENAAVSTAAAYYVRMTGIPRGRLVSLTLTGAVTKANWQYQWQALVPEYPEASGENTGQQYWNPNVGAMSGDPFFYGIGRDLILRVGLSSMADFTVAWTSTEAPTPLQPSTWYDRQVISPAGGTIAYDGVPYAPSQSATRYYSFTPTTSDPLTVTCNEPDGDWEVYAEDGVRSFDVWMGRGRNLADGTQDPGWVLQIDPTAGQEYVVVVYANGLPTPETQWAVTVAQQTFTAPYVVSNDLFANPISLGDLTDGLTHAYDNTGATTDVVELPGGKRSIWYTFRVVADSMVRLTLIPSDTADAKLPTTTILTADRVNAGSGDTATYVRLAPGLYHLGISFNSAAPTSDWEQHGSMAFGVVPTPPHIVDPNFTLLPGSTDPGGGQNYHVGPTFPGSSFGSQGSARIVAPSDGGLSLIIEAGSEGGTTQFPDVQVKLMGYVGPPPFGYGYGTADGPLSLYTTFANYDPLSPYVMPWRPAGTASVEPVTFSVKAGDVILVSVASAPSGCFIRWGMTTATRAPSDWVSARYGDYLTMDGATTSGLTTDQAAALRAGADAWPLDNLVITGQRPNDVSGNPADTGRASAWTYNNSSSLKSIGGGLTSNDAIRWEPIQDTHLLTRVTGGETIVTPGQVGTGPGRGTDSYPIQAGLENKFRGSVLYDPADGGTVINLDTELQLVRQQAYAAHDPRYEVSLNDGTGAWQPGDPATFRWKELAYDTLPIRERAGQGALDAYRPWRAPDEGSALLRLLTWKIEWEGGGSQAKEVYNVYRWTGSIVANRVMRGPYDPLNGWEGYPFNLFEANPDYPASSPWPTQDHAADVKVYDVPVEVTDANWVSPGVVASGEVVHDWQFSNEPLILAADGSETQLHLTVTQLGKERPSGVGFAEDLWKADVFGGARPSIGAKFYDETYSLMTDPFLNDLDWGTVIKAYWDRRGYINQAGATDQFSNGSILFNYQVNTDVHTWVGRVYPGRFRVAAWVPSLDAIAPVIPQPAAGSTLTEAQDITGEPGAVVVHFATT